MLLLMLLLLLLLLLLPPTSASHTTYGHCLLSLSAFVKRLPSTAAVVGDACVKAGSGLALTCQTF